MSWFNELFGDNSASFNNYANQMNQMGNSYNPYVTQGQQAGQQFGDLSNMLTQDPNALQNQIASGFQMSPYQQYLMKMTTDRSNMNAANSGMIQSPVAQEALNAQISALGGQFQNEYINRGMQSFGQGYQGLGNLNEMGYNALGAKNEYLGAGAAGRFQGDTSRRNAFNNMIGTGIGIGANFIAPGSGSFFKGAMGGGGQGGWGGGGAIGSGGGLTSDFGY